MLSAVASGPAVAQAKPQLPPIEAEGPQLSIVELADRAGGKLTAGDFAGAKADLLRVIEMREFAASSEDYRGRIYVTLGATLSGLDEHEEALRYLERAEGHAAELKRYYWPVYFWAAMSADEMVKAAHAASIIAVELPDVVATWKDSWVLHLLQGTSNLPEAHEDRIVLLDMLWRTGFTTNDAGWAMEYYYQELLDARIRQGDLEEAGRVAQTLRGPDAVQQLSTNAAYAPFAPDDISAALSEAFEIALQRLRIAVEDQPNLAEPIVNLAAWLNHAGKPSEAIEVLDAALARVAEAPTGVAAFDDQREQLEWLHYDRAFSLKNVGRWGDALAAQIEARRVADAVAPGEVSQAVNLGTMYLYLGKPELAAEVITGADPNAASEHGLMSIQRVRACAAYQTGDTVGAAAIVAEMHSTAAADLFSLAWAMLCTDDVDGAAKLFAAQLAGLETRRAALDFLQRFRLPDNQPELYRLMESRKDEVRAHPLVQAALKDTGKILEWPAYN